MELSTLQHNFFAKNTFLSQLLERLIQYFPTVLFFFALLLVLFVFISFVRKLLNLRRALREETIFLELTPPSITEKSAYTTEQLFALIHGLARQRAFWDKFTNFQKSYSLEIVSTKDEGIRYVLRIPEIDAELIKKSLFAYMPGLSVIETQDYLLQDIVHTEKISEFHLANHFAFPLKKQNTLNEHDPIAYITGNMTKLSAGELMSFQLIVSPVNKSSVLDIKRIIHLISTNQDLLKSITSLKNSFFSVELFNVFFSLFFKTLFFPLGLLVFLASNGKDSSVFNSSNNLRKPNNAYQEELEQLVKDKLDQQLFRASVRILIVGNNKATLTKRSRGFISALSSFSNSGYQSLISSFNLRIKLFQTIKMQLFKHRLLGFWGNSIFSISEVADLYHFPFTKTTRTENIVKVHSKELPAPVSLKKVQEQDIVFARNTYGGNNTMIGLNQEERRRHMYILGATGTGKSTLLLSMIKQDIEHGKGLCVIDPHGDLIEKVLNVIPKNRIKDVIYFNPDDIGYPVGLNLLELPRDVTGDLLLREKELIAESIISLFHKIYDDKYSGPRMEYILRNTIHTAFIIPNPTLFTIYKLLINEDFRKEVTSKLEDENLKDFWRYEFNKAGDYQKVKMISPITNKIGRFLFSPTAKRILEQERSTINFDDVMDNGKILLCNVSKGRIGEDNSEVFGTLIMAKIQLAALKRARVIQEERKDFYLYVDEFQNFATPSFAQILSEARKYKLNAILAHQTTSQLEDKSLVNITLANTGTIICFRTANPEDERLILPQFIPYVQPGEIDNLPSYHFYIKISALHPEEPFSGETVPVTVARNDKLVEQVIKESREHFAIQFIEKPNISIRQKETVKKEKPVISRQPLGVLP